MRNWSSIASRALFVVAFGFTALAVWERLANMMGQTLTFLNQYPPSRLLDVAALARLFVIALQLREMKGMSTGPRG